MNPGDNVTFTDPFTQQQKNPFQIDNISQGGFFELQVTDTNLKRSIRVLFDIHTPDIFVEWFEDYSYTDSPPTDGGAAGLFDGPLFSGEKLCFNTAFYNFFTANSCSGDAIDVLTATSDNVSLSDNWTAVDTHCALESFCKIQRTGGVDKFDLVIGFFDAGEVYIVVMPHFNTPPEIIGQVHTVAVRGQTSQIDLSGHVYDPDNDTLHYEIDNSSMLGSAILDNSSSGLVSYTASNTAGRDNFSFRVTDNISLNPSRWAIVHIDVINPAPTYNVDNFTARVDNGSTITTSWNLFPDNGSQAPEGFLLICSSADNISASLPQDRTTLGHGMSYDACGDGFGYVYLDNHTHDPHGAHAMPTQFTWENLTLHQQYFFGIYSLTNNFNNFKYVNYFDGVGATDNKTTSNPPVARDVHFELAVGDNLTEVLLDNVTDVDNDSFTFYWDHSNTRGTLIINDNSTGNFTYIADNGSGLDNFSYYVIDNYSVASHPALVSLQVVQIDPAPAYNVDNFTARVDNGSTITTSWNLFPDNGSQAPEGFLLICSSADNISASLPQDRTTLGHGMSYDACGDGFGYVYLDNHTHEPHGAHAMPTQFTWENLTLHQQYFFTIYSFTNGGTPYIDYFDGDVVTVTAITNTTPFAADLTKAFDKNPGDNSTAGNFTLPASDADGDSLIFTIIKFPDNGTLEMLDNQTGLIRYNPNDNFTGADNFTFIVADNFGAQSNIGYVSIDVLETDQTSEIVQTVLFATQYERLSSPVNDAWTRTKEGGLVYVAAGWDGGVQDQEGKWDYGWYETSGADVVTRQSYGKQWAHDSALDDNDTIYIAVKGPNGGKVDVSGTDTLVIQMGNGAQGEMVNTHNVFTIALKGGVQSTDDYSWSEICTVDQTVSSTHQFGLSTYYLPLSSFSCSSGSLEALRTEVTEVVVQVIGGKNPEQDTTTSFNHTMPSVGFIGFTNSTAVGSSAPAANVLFASQYAPIAGASAEPFIVTEEGEVYGFSGGKFTYADYGVTHDGPGVPAAQAYGAIFQHSEAVTEADYFGWTIKGPGNGSVNACGADELVIQLGNAQASTGEFAAANSHMTYTVELKDASGQLCGHDLTLAENTRPGQEGANNFGLQTYYIPMSEFSGCSASAISEVAVKVVGGKDAEASASTEGNATFPVFGFIGFTGDNEEACEVTQSPEMIRPEGYQLVWSDDFDQGDVPDSTKWNYDLGSPLLG